MAIGNGEIAKPPFEAAKAVFLWVTAFAAPFALSIGGAVGGWYAGFHIVGVPQGPDCGLAAIPASIAGFVGAAAGLLSGGIGGVLCSFLVIRTFRKQFAGNFVGKPQSVRDDFDDERDA